MEADELKMLAEIAGVEYHENKGYGYYCNEGLTKFFNEVDWQPHLRIDQAMMVAESLKKNRLYLVLEFLASSYRAHFRVDMVREKISSRLHFTPAEAVCAAALAALKRP